MGEKDTGLDAAYALETPDDNLRLYADWADSYDQTFAEDHGYIVPAQVAEAFDGSGRVFDVGAGTGLVGQALHGRGLQIDGLDISQDMLNVARTKGCYARLFTGDLTGALEIADATYDGVISAGTFTHGHVGPDAIDELLRVAKPGARFVLGINKEHFTSQGFEAKFKAISAQIIDLRFETIRLYGEGAKGDHADDEGLIALFTKA